VDLADLDGGRLPAFFVSPVPFLYCEGEYAMSPGTPVLEADSYPALRVLLTREFHIPAAALPPSTYFRPTKEEKENGEEGIYRTVPKGAGEPEWRTKARQALLDAVDEAGWSVVDKAKVTVDGKDCFSVEELRQALACLAEAAGGKKRVIGEAYQPDYDVLVEEALARDGFLLQIGLPKLGKRQGRL